MTDSAGQLLDSNLAHLTCDLDRLCNRFEVLQKQVEGLYEYNRENSHSSLRSLEEDIFHLAARVGDSKERVGVTEAAMGGLQKAVRSLEQRLDQDDLADKVGDLEQKLDESLTNVHNRFNDNNEQIHLLKRRVDTVEEGQQSPLPKKPLRKSDYAAMLKLVSKYLRKQGWIGSALLTEQVMNNLGRLEDGREKSLERRVNWKEVSDE